MSIFYHFDEVSAIRWPKMMTFSLTGSQIFFANFVIFVRNERKTAYRFIVHNTKIFQAKIYVSISLVFERVALMIQADMTIEVDSIYHNSLGGLCVTNPPIRLRCPTSVCPSTFFVSGL